MVLLFSFSSGISSIQEGSPRRAGPGLQAALTHPGQLAGCWRLQFGLLVGPVNQLLAQSTSCWPSQPAG
jgi:hypothetical protein